MILFTPRWCLRRLGAWALAAGLATFGLGQTAHAGTQEQSSLAQVIDDYAAAHDFSGTILVSRDEEILYRHGIGLAERAFEAPAGVDTRYRIASITKLFTATLVLQLVDEGRIDLSDPIGTYLPTYAGDRSIPLYSLLNHTSGLPNPDSEITFEMAVTEGIPLYQSPHDTDALLDEYASGAPMRSPGEAFDYSNADYIVLGKIVEAVSGESFEAVLQHRILGPLNLADTGMIRQRDVIPRLASTYLRLGEDEPLINDLPVLMENWYAAGAMYSTVDDVGRFADALYEGRLLRPGTLDAMLTPGLDEYGYGLWIWDQRAGDRSFRAAVRFGGVMGANAVLYRILDEDITIVILGNTNASDMGDFAHRIATTLLN